MTLTEFISKFSAELDISNEISETTKYKELENWDSMQALVIIMMVDDIFNVQIGSDDFNKAETLSDLYFRIEELRKNR
ncbi:MAG: phosphopantetheine-binding protein [Treponema sp.]|nr:phosphopantetheine-binding protein [Treponema sp.]